MKTKPKKCCHPNCFECPYKDCRWQEMTSQDFSESNSRDYELFESATGGKYHKGTDKEYRNLRQMAYRSEHPVKRERVDYHRKYYKEHCEEIKRQQKENYDTRKNTKSCRRWRKKNIEKKREYDRQRYLKRKAAKAIENKVGEKNDFD